MYTKVKEELDALKALVKQDHGLVNSNDAPIWTAAGWEMRVCFNLQEPELWSCQMCLVTNNSNLTFTKILPWVVLFHIDKITDSQKKNKKQDIQVCKQEDELLPAWLWRFWPGCPPDTTH